MANQPSIALRDGIKILEPVLVPHGFEFVFRTEGRGSSGDFALGEFIRGDRRLELHYWYSFGPVAYHVGDLWLDHVAYMRALQIPDEQRRYPGFSGDSATEFGHLKHDLVQFAGEFLSGSAPVLTRVAQSAASERAADDLAMRARSEGDARKRLDARQSFRQGDFPRVVALLETVHYPDLLHESELRLLEIARARSTE
jgi:hypothetical protein